MTIREHEGATARPQAWVPTKKKTADLAISGLGGIQRFRWGGTLWGNVPGGYNFIWCCNWGRTRAQLWQECDLFMKRTYRSDMTLWLAGLVRELQAQKTGLYT